MSISIVGLDHLVLRVADIDRSIAFYCGVLGCVVEKRQPTIGLVQLRAGGQLIDLVALDGPIGREGGAGPGPEGRNLDHFALRVATFDAAAIARHLTAHGVEPGDVVERYGSEGSGPSMYIRDPDGTMVELKGPARPGTSERK